MRDIDLIIEAVRHDFPRAEVYQLQVAYPGDDDGIWYFYFPGSKDDIQIQSSYGMCPFIVETNRTPLAREGKTVEEIVMLIREHLATVNLSD